MASGVRDESIVVVALSERDASVIDDLEQFQKEVQSRIGRGIIVILVNEAGIPLAPPIDAHDIPSDAIWLPSIGL